MSSLDGSGLRTKGACRRATLKRILVGCNGGFNLHQLPIVWKEITYENQV
jgi:hypothetical protein